MAIPRGISSPLFRNLVMWNCEYQCACRESRCEKFPYFRLLPHQITAGELIWHWLTPVCIYELNAEHFVQERIMISGGLDYSCIMHDEPESSVHDRCSCLQTEVRSYLYAAWHSVLMKINEVWIFDSLRLQEFCSAQIICRLQWNIFAWTLLLVGFHGYPIFAALC